MRTHKLLTALPLFLAPALACASGDSLFASGLDPGMGFQTFHLPDKNDAVACSARRNASAVIGPVYFAQMHFLEPTHPFFHLNADRPVLLKANVVGAGASPEVKVTAKIDGKVIGSLCLKGPATLPASVDPATQSRENSFTVTLPSAWVRQGLSVMLSTGSNTREFDAPTLGIGPAPVLTLVVQEMFLFGAKVPSTRWADWQMQYLSALPISALNVASLVDLHIEQLALEPRGDGRDRFGNAMAQPATVATRNASCTTAEKSAGNCTTYGGYAILNTSRRVVGAIMNANGMSSYGQSYALLSSGNRAGGGIAGGGTGAGDDMGGIFNHEMGHSSDMPHWGGAWYGRTAAADTRRYPYSGEFGTLPDNPVGGGFGNSWGYDILADRIITPICASTGKERQDPLQRSNGCADSAGRYDTYSDYSALQATRFFVGAPNTLIGAIPYPRDPIGNAAATPFAFPTQGGKSVIEQPNFTRPLITRWNAAQQRYLSDAPPNISADQKKHRYPEKYNVKVVTFWGTHSNTTPGISRFGTPLHYVGNLMKTWDPSDPADFADIKHWVSGEAFWWGADLVLRVDYADGSHRAAVIKAAPRSEDPLDGGSYAIWAINLPDDKEIVSARLYRRPMEVRNPGTDTPYNINRTGNPTTAENYLATARISTTYP